MDNYKYNYYFFGVDRTPAIITDDYIKSYLKENPNYPLGADTLSKIAKIYFAHRGICDGDTGVFVLSENNCWRRLPYSVLEPYRKISGYDLDRMETYHAEKAVKSLMSIDEMTITPNEVGNMKMLIKGKTADKSVELRFPNVKINFDIVRVFPGEGDVYFTMTEHDNEQMDSND